MDMFNFPIKAVLGAFCLISTAVYAEPPIFGSGLFGCDYKSLLFSDYVKKTNKSIEICKAKGGYNLTIGKYNDPFDTQIIYFKQEDVEIIPNKVILSGYYKYTLEVNQFGGGTLIRNNGKVEELVEVLSDDSLHTLNNINRHVRGVKELEDPEEKEKKDKEKEEKQNEELFKSLNKYSN